MGIPSQPCSIHPLTFNFRQRPGDESHHVTSLEKGQFPSFTLPSLPEDVVHVLPPESGYATSLVPADPTQFLLLRGMKRVFSPFMLDMYQGWDTYQYIFNFSERYGWDNTQILTFTHKLRIQTNRAMSYLAGKREQAPTLDQWTYRGMEIKKSGSDFKTRSRGRGSKTSKSKEGTTSSSSSEVNPSNGKDQEEEEEGENAEETQHIRRRKKAMENSKIIYTGQKIQFKNNRELYLVEEDPTRSGLFLHPGYDGPVRKMNSNRVSMVESIFYCFGGEPTAVTNTMELNFGKGFMNCLQLVDCDDANRERYIVEVSWMNLKNDIRDGYCIVIDSAQGIQRRAVFVLMEPMMRRKRAYTAITRGSECAAVFFCPYNNRGKDRDLAGSMNDIKRCLTEPEPPRVSALSRWIVHSERERAKQEKKRDQNVEKKNRVSTSLYDPPPPYDSVSEWFTDSSEGTNDKTQDDVNLSEQDSHKTMTTRKRKNMSSTLCSSNKQSHHDSGVERGEEALTTCSSSVNGNDDNDPIEVCEWFA